METTILELSKYTSNNGTNSDWTNVLCKPVKVDTNTYISVKQAFIDTRQINATTIELPQDVTWTLYFMYYIIGHGIAQINPTNTKEGNTYVKPDGKPYIMCRTAASEGTPYIPVIDAVQITIPAGLYDRTFLANYITKKFQSVNGQLEAVPTMIFTNGNIYPIWDSNGDIIGFTPLTLPLNPEVVTTFIKPLLVRYDTDYLPHPPPKPYTSTIIEGAGIYTPVYFVPMCGDTLYNNPDGYIVPAAVIPDQQKNTVYEDTWLWYYDGGITGATQIALVYNDNNSGRYSFQYIHSPILNNGDEVTGNYSAAQATPNNLTTSTTAWLNSHSGIMFCHTYTNLSANPNQVIDTTDNPFVDPFFEQLGLRYSDIVNPDVLDLEQVNIQLPNLQFSYANFLKYTTKNFYPVSGFTSGATTDINADQKYKIETYANKFLTGGYSFDTASITDEIYFSGVPISSNTNAGHYLIEISYGADEGYINRDKTMMIKGVIGSFYLSGDSFVQSMGPDSIVYNPHNGVPFLLNTLNIRILNPVTKEPETLGPNSTIYLQVSREIKDPLPEPTKQTTPTKNVSPK
jgi:hypothetical protein